MPSLQLVDYLNAHLSLKALIKQHVNQVNLVIETPKPIFVGDL